MPRRKIDSPNPDIDRLIQSVMAQAKSGECDIKTTVEVIKVAAGWEKIKHGIKESDEGEFFKMGDIDD